MKNVVDEINSIHKSLSDVQGKINDLYSAIGTGRIKGRDIRDSIYRERIDLLTEDYNKLKERLKELVNE
jgi:tetrahydromethanopterin S-methyltransferase subunit G